MSIKEFISTPFKEFFKFRELIAYQVRAEFKQKHFQKALGPIWWFGEPIFMALIFIFLTTVLFRQTFDEHYQLILIMSVLIWRWFSRSLDGAPALLSTFQFELKKTNLPILPLIFTNIIVEIMFFGFALIVIFAGIFLSGITLTLNVLYLPIPIIVQLTMIIGITTFLAKAGVFFKDLAQIVWVGVAIWFYLSPGIYPSNLIPEEYLWLYNLNPFATIFPAWRDILIDGTQPDLVGLGIWFIIFLPVAIYGLGNLAKSRSDFFKKL